MKVAVVGIGVVGSSVLKSFMTKGIDVVPFDKYKNVGTIEDILNTDIAFLCLPTLYSYELSSYDKSSIIETCQYLSEHNYKGLVVIKSTVEPTTSEGLGKHFGLQVLHNPEFLTAKTAFEDFHMQSHVIIGQTTGVTDEKTQILGQFFKTHYPQSMLTICSSTESESIKIFCNCFYAVKVQFFNECYILCQKLGIDYNLIRDSMLKNNWINPMHTQVPGTDGKLSYGGMCFPKDTNALLSFMKIMGVPHKVLEGAVEERKEIRGNDS